MIKRGLLPLFALLAFSCNNFREEQKPQAVARVNDAYLYREDIKGIVPAGVSKEDSIAIVKSYIDRWASQKLMYGRSQVNLGQEKQTEYDELVRQYKVDLYTRAYVEEIVKSTVDTVVSKEEAVKYYNASKENFRTTGMLVRLRYIRMAKDHPKFGSVQSKFTSGNKKDLKALNDMAIQFKSYAFNDSTWVDMNEVYSKLPFITPENRDRFISSGISYQYPEASDVYLVKVARVIDKDQVAPFEYIRPTLEQLIINNRKLELIKQFEKEITDDAIKDKKYEIYK
jgi:hypothetical protein